MTNIKIGKYSEVIISILLIIFISAVSFLPLIRQLGYYIDDWFPIWGFLTSGSDKVASIYAFDRPFTGFIVGQEFKLIGVEPINWHILMFFMRISSSLLFFWIVRFLWRNQKTPTLIMSLIYSTYPGFLLTPEAVTYQALFLGINLGLLSIILGLYAIHTNRIIYKSLLFFISCLLLLSCLLMVEWLIGILGIYIILIFYEINKLNKSIYSSIRKTIFYSLPSFLVTGLFLIWRIFIYEDIRKYTDIGYLLSKYGNQTISRSFNFVFNTLRSFVSSTIMPWVVPINSLWWVPQKKILIQGLIFASLAFIVIGIVFLLQRKNTEQDENNYSENWSRDGMVIGFLSVLITLIPVTFSGRQVYLLSTFNRYTLSSVTGVSILIVSSLYYLIKHSKFIYIFTAGILFISIFTHFLNSNSYREEFQIETNFWWQLSWRAPDIKDNTVFIPVALTFIDYYDIFPEINIIYRPDSKELKISAQILNSDTAREILVSNNIQNSSYRGFDYQRDYKKILLVSQTKNSCLHVWDGSQTALAGNQNPLLSLIAPLSNISTIDTKSGNHLPPENIFGEEPAHDWCYFYQKASLARQDSDWNTIINLAQELNKQKLHPLDVSEWMPFFEGFANLNQNEEAKGIALRMKSDMVTIDLICKGFTSEKPITYNNTSDSVYNFMKQTLCE